MTRAASSSSPRKHQTKSAARLLRHWQPGGGDLRAMHQTGLAEIVALCDVDMGGPHTLKNLKTFDSQPRFQDFREMFDRMADQIDAVTVGTRFDFFTFPSPCSPCPWASMSMSKSP